MVPTTNDPKTTSLDRFDSAVNSLLHPGCDLEWVVQFLDYLCRIILVHGMVVSGWFGVAGSATPGGGAECHLCVHMVPPKTLIKSSAAQSPTPAVQIDNS